MTPATRAKILVRISNLVQEKKLQFSDIFAMVAGEFHLTAAGVKTLAYTYPHISGVGDEHSVRLTKEQKKEILVHMALGHEWEYIATELKVSYHQVAYLARKNKAKIKTTQKKRPRYTASAAQSSANQRKDSQKYGTIPQRVQRG